MSRTADVDDEAAVLKHQLLRRTGEDELAPGVAGLLPEARQLGGRRLADQLGVVDEDDRRAFSRPDDPGWDRFGGGMGRSTGWERQGRAAYVAGPGNVVKTGVHHGQHARMARERAQG